MKRSHHCTAFKDRLGAAITLAPQSMPQCALIMRFVWRYDGRTAQEDGFRRQYYGRGTGMAWIDYRQIDTDRRDGFAEPSLQVKYVERFLL